MAAKNDRTNEKGTGAGTVCAPPFPHIVVLGAGFGGLTFAQRFPEGLARITLIDRTNHHLFQPLLYQVAAAGLAVPDIAQPIRAILAPKRDVTVLMGEVTKIDVGTRRIALGDTWFSYDFLVVALGGRTSYFGHPEWEPYAPGLKSASDALRIRRNVLHAFESAERTDDPAERQRLLTTVVIGGGPAGVELAGAFAELQRHVLAKDFRRVNAGCGRVILIEAGERLLTGFSPRLSTAAQHQLESLGVNVWLGQRVSEIREGEVVLGQVTVPAGNIIWAAGVAANSLAVALGAPTDRSGRVMVQPDLSLSDHPEVFVIGDMAVITDKRGCPVPGISPAAIQMGEYVARTIATSVQPAAPSARQPFVYRDKGTMATIGRSRAVARIGGFEFSGPVAWVLWLLVHLLFLIGFRNKLSVLMQWAYAYVTYKPGARVIYGQPPATAAHPPVNIEQSVSSLHSLT